MGSPSHDQVLEIIRAGILAPSADNRHAVRFEVSSGKLAVWAEPELLKSAERHRTILTLIAVGAVVENVLLAATAQGFTGVPRFFPDWQGSGLVAEIVWRASDAVENPLAGAIPLRHTNRRFFHGPRLEPRQQALLNAEVAKIDAAQLCWLEGTQRKAALRLVLLAETERFGTETLHRELFSAIRFDIGWIESCDEGLPPGSLEVEPLLRPVFAALRDWKLMRRLNKVGLHHMLGVRAAYLPCRLSPHLGVISTENDPEVGAIAVGRAFERLWLRATLMGLALQPVVASVVLPLDEDGGSSRSMSEKTRSEVKVAWGKLNPGRVPLMLFRLGRAKAPSVTTSRKPVDAYLLRGQERVRSAAPN